MDEKFYKEIKKTIDTNLVFADIEILGYHKDGEIEVLKIELPFTTTSNILTYKYNCITDELELIDAIIYAMKDNHQSEKAYIDRKTIMKIYDYSRNKLGYRKTQNTIDKTKVTKLYDVLIKGFPLTKEILTLYNFTDEDIEELQKENIIKETETNKWIITDIDDLYKYGIYLQIINQPYKAEDCFRKCYKLEPTNRKVCLQLLLFELKRKNFIAAQKMFSLLEEIESEKYQEDNNLYLYLLGITLYNNREYQARMKNMTYEDVLIPYYKEYENKTLQNKIRTLILDHKYPYALNLINDLKREDLTYNIEHELLKELTINAITLNKKFKSKLKKAAENKDYIKILELLEAKSRNQNLSNMEQNILLVTNSILEIINTNKIPPVYIENTTFLYGAIKNNNFKLAKKLNIAFLKKTNQNPDEDILNVLLNDINNRIEKITPKENETKENDKTITIREKEDISKDEELAYYIKDMNLPFKENIKNLGILPEQLALIKLIYARDYFFEGNYEEGNKLLKEVEDTKLSSSKIIELLNEIKEMLLKEKTEKSILSKTKNKEML